MKLNKLRNKWLLILLLISVAIVIFLRWEHDNTTKLNGSLHHLMQEILDNHYEVSNNYLLGNETDQSGYWIITVGDTFFNNLTKNKLFNLADDADLEYMTKVFQEKFNLHDSLAKFELFRAEFPLESNSICEKYPCNISILAKKDSNKAFVYISKI